MKREESTSVRFQHRLAVVKITKSDNSTTPSCYSVINMRNGNTKAHFLKKFSTFFINFKMLCSLNLRMNGFIPIICPSFTAFHLWTRRPLFAFCFWEPNRRVTFYKRRNNCSAFHIYYNSSIGKFHLSTNSLDFPFLNYQ